MAHNHMDHSHMGHGDMDMGHGHGGDGSEEAMMCSMNMLFTWSTDNLCIVFRSWRVTGTWSLLWSLVAIMALTAGYEAVREVSRRYEARMASAVANMPRTSAPRETTTSHANAEPTERSSLLMLGTGSTVAAEEQRGKVVKAALYAVQVFYSFFIMLLFMTYNGWIMLAVGVGAFIGFLLFSGTSSTKSAACH